MRILSLDLLAFGPFTDVSLPLDEGHYGLHVIYGANEAGKSSALRALSQFFYGIPHNSSDNFIHTNQNMRIGATLHHSTGNVLECIRRKGQKKTLRAADDEQVIDDQRIVELLGGIDEATFRHRFGIDYQELVRGGQAIVEGKGDLGEILFAAGAGVADLRAVQSQLAERAEALFKRRGSVQQISKALSDLATARRAIKDAQLPSSEWLAHDEALQEARLRKSQIEKQLRDLDAENNRLERVKDALPLIALRGETLAQLHDVAEANILPDDFSEKRRNATAQLAAAQTKQAGVVKEIDRIEREIAELDDPDPLLKHKSTITQLHTDLGSYLKAAKDRPNLVNDRERAEKDAKSILRELGKGEDLSQSQQLHLSRTQRAAVQSLGNQCQALMSKCEDANENLRKQRAEIDRITGQLSQTQSPREVSELRRAIRRARQLGDIDQQSSKANAEVDRLENQAPVDLERLPGWSGSLDELEKLSVPSVETVDRFESEFGDAESAVKSLNKEITDNQTQVQNFEQSLQALRLEGDVPTEEDLAHARRRRDEGWNLVRKAWQDDEPGNNQTRDFVNEFAQDGDLAEAFVASVNAADQISDRLRREADRVAQHAKLQSDRETINQRIDRMQADLTNAKSNYARVEREWSNLWKAIGVLPLSPREMRSWISQQADLVKTTEAIRNQRSAANDVRATIDTHRRQLNDCLVDLDEPRSNDKDPFAVIIDRCDDLAEQIEDANRARADLERALENRRENLPNLERDAQKASDALNDWRANWTSAIEKLGLTGDAMPAEANNVLDTIEELFGKLKEANDSKERIKGIDDDADEFTQTVQRLNQQISPDLATLPVEQAVNELFDRLEIALRTQTTIESRGQQLNDEKAKHDEAGEEINKWQSLIETMCREAGCSSQDELPEAERRSDQRQKLERECKELNKRLIELAGGLQLEQFIDEASQHDADQLPGMLVRLGDDIQQLTEEKSKVDQTIGREENEQQRMDGSAHAAESQELAEYLAAKIRSDAEQYTRFRLAAAILNGTIERYREKNQGPVLQRASDIFADLTGGSFEALRADYNQKGEAILVGVRGETKQPVSVAGFSEGTECQLYLALRLAILETYLDGHEPIPFVVDDILKDFDDDRSVAALKALAQLSEKTQVILFTHHKHLVRLAEESLDDDMLFVHELDCRGPARNLRIAAATDAE